MDAGGGVGGVLRRVGLWGLFLAGEEAHGGNGSLGACCGSGEELCLVGRGSRVGEAEVRLLLIFR